MFHYFFPVKKKDAKVVQYSYDNLVIPKIGVVNDFGVKFDSNLSLNIDVDHIRN